MSSAAFCEPGGVEKWDEVIGCRDGALEVLMVDELEQVSRRRREHVAGSVTEPVGPVEPARSVTGLGGGPGGDQVALGGVVARLRRRRSARGAAARRGP